MKTKRQESQRQMHQAEKTKQLEKIRELYQKLSPSKVSSSAKGSPARNQEEGRIQDISSIKDIHDRDDANVSTEQGLISKMPVHSYAGLATAGLAADCNVSSAQSIDSAGSAGAAGLAASSTEQFSLEDAFAKLNLRLDSVDAKLDDVVTKSSLETSITAALNPLKNEVAELKGRVHDLETKSSGSGLSSAQVKLLNSVDPAFRSLRFSGFSSGIDPGTRITDIEAILSKLPDSKHLTVENVMKGPVNNRSITKHVVVEFPSRRLAERALAALGGKGKHFTTIGGSEVSMKMDVTKINRERNWAIYKAKELIASSPGGANASIDMKERQIKVGGMIAFKQEQNDTQGSFCGVFSTLSLPS
jgi:hypothetical protein